LAADARLASLESRLHPHFLFNAIAAISGEIREAPDRAERLLGEFADLLRASLDSSGRHVGPLRDEVTVVQAYLEIEKARPAGPQPAARPAGPRARQPAGPAGRALRLAGGARRRPP